MILYIWEPHKDETQRQLRLIYYPELKKWIGARVSKGRRAVHRKMRRTDVW